MFADAAIGKRLHEMVEKAREVARLDVESRVHFGQGSAGIAYWPVEGRCEEFALHRLQGLGRDTFEEGTQLGVCEDAPVETEDRFVDGFIAAESFVECRLLLCHGRTARVCPLLVEAFSLTLPHAHAAGVRGNDFNRTFA
jgi:hypothetical protein